MSLKHDTIIHGDSLAELAKLPEKSIDLVFADPPYNLQLQNDLLRPEQTRFAGVDDAWDQFADTATYDAFTRDWLRACRRVLKDDGTLWVIGTYHNIFRVGTILMDLGYWILNDVLWVKTNPPPNFRGSRFTNATETLIWAKKTKDSRYTFNYHAMKHLNDDKQMGNVWHLPICTGAERLKTGGKKAHSTQKPEALLYRVIAAASDPGDIVLDPFFGTGTTGAVARKLGRHFIGIEREAAYVQLARDRIAAIADAAPDESLLVTPSKRHLPRVAFAGLVEAGYLHIGQNLYDEARQHTAIIKADSYIMVGDFTGSIHQVAAHLMGRERFNGWDYWYYEAADGALVSIDDLRAQYRAEHF